jgi:hypothetical protein
LFIIRIVPGDGEIIPRNFFGGCRCVFIGKNHEMIILKNTSIRQLVARVRSFLMAAYPGNPDFPATGRDAVKEYPAVVKAVARYAAGS